MRRAIIYFLILSQIYSASRGNFLINRIDEFLQEKISDPSKMEKIMTSGSMDGFFSSDQINEIFSHLVKKYPKYISPTQIGQSIQKNPIMSYRLSTNLASEFPKSKVLFTGLHHSREVLVANMMVKIFLETLHSLKHETSQLTYFNFCDVLIIPIVNVDGHLLISRSFSSHNREDYKLKRKNMNPKYCKFDK